MKQLLTLGLITFLITSCNEKESTPIYTPTITSFEVNKTEAYPEESIIVTADATCDSDEPLDYSFTSNKGTIKTDGDPKKATLTLPRTDGEVIVTLDVKSTTDSISDIKTVKVLPVKFYDRFKSDSQISYKSNVKTSFTNDMLKLSRGEIIDRTSGWLSFRQSSLSKSTFNGFITKLSTNGINEDKNYAILRTSFALDPDKQTDKQLVALYFFISPREDANHTNFYIRAIMRDIETSTNSYKDIVPFTKNRNTPSINTKDEQFVIEANYDKLANLNVSINNIELFDPSSLNNLLISEGCSSTNIINEWGLVVFNNMELNVDYIYFPE
ncbi:hypothetical protein [Saccharicrinis aurantiacus]|uniref:hypothetical protein n=1 Tax=Saccharicrinis aurantiacus TaxID=1849719 RepID=UPI00248FAD6A|nr:hypothetical protein [Saccharicrinis aurantiacus]